MNAFTNMNTEETTPVFQPFEVEFETPLDCTHIFPEGGEATGAKVLDEAGRFSLVGAGKGRVIGQISGLTQETAAESIKIAVVAAANL